MLAVLVSFFPENFPDFSRGIGFQVHYYRCLANTAVGETLSVYRRLLAVILCVSVASNTSNGG